LLLIMDYLYRGWRSVAIFVRYWFGSAVGLPDIEIQKQKSAEQSEPIGVKILAFLTSPYFVLFIVAVIIFAFLYVLLDIYMPFVEDYYSGCASPQQENGPGTIISTNAAALIYNQAVENGQKEMQNHLTDYDSLRQNICGQYYSQTGTTEQDLQQLLVTNAQAYATATAALQLMDTCLPPATVQTDFVNYTDSRGYSYTDSEQQPLPFNYPGYDFDSAVPCPADAMNAYNLTNMVFNCSHVALCESFDLCTQAIDRPTLNHGAWKASCDSEHLVLVGITKAGMSIVVYIFWNIGRILLVMGLGRLLWRNLVPHGFNYIATCSTDGKIDRDTEKEVAEKLKSIISVFERWGLVYIGLAIFLQLCWLIPLVVFSTQVASLSTT